ncbi:hypothetical protein JRI60_08030 [Archangium violaceum]|uniref:hypothetical protein n=1 Tax=Archangium violaceum TaxID=83451 RepID=UPI00195146C2|nr:hypothetical protein [Archangium violaceum]QRN98966.1 hypothetical protein JRI60_08030 [Archangium violaceum]
MKRLWLLALLPLAGCLPVRTVTLVTAEKVEVPVCPAPPPAREIPPKPDLPVDHLSEDMEAADVVLAYRQTVVLLEGWGEALQILLQAYQPTGPAPREPGPPSAEVPPPPAPPFP